MFLKISALQLDKIKQFAKKKGWKIKADIFYDYGEKNKGMWNHVVIFYKGRKEILRIEKRTFSDGRTEWTDNDIIYVKKVDKLLEHPQFE